MTEPVEETLAHEVRRGLRWSFVSNVLSRLGTFVTGIILARLLAPTDYGVFTVALVAMTVLVNINDLGMEQTLVRWPGKRIDDVAGTATTIIFGFSVLLFGVCFAGSGAFATAMGAPEAAPIVAALSFGILVNGIFAVPSASLTRSLRQDLRTYADLSGFFLGTGLTIILAFNGAGVWSLVWGRLAGNLAVGTLHFVLAPIRYRPGWDSSRVGELLRSSLPLAGATVIAVVLLNIDYVVVGRLLGTEDLGYYTMAFNLASWPVTFFAVAVARVSVPAFARLQAEPARVQSAFERSMTLLMVVTVPACLLLGVFAEPLIRFVYGDKWAPAAAVLQWLALLGLLRVVYQLCADVLIAVGASSRVLLTQVVWLVALVGGLVLGARWGLVGIGIGHVAVAIFVVGPTYVLCLRGVVRLRPLVRPSVRIAAAAVPAALAGWAVTASSLSPFFTLALGAPLLLVIYLLGTHLLMRHHGVDIRAAIAGARRKST